MPENRGIVLFARTQTDVGVALFVDHDLPNFPKTPQLPNNPQPAAAVVAARQFAFQQLQQQQAAQQQQSQNALGAGAGMGLGLGPSNPNAAQNAFLMAQMRAQQANQAQQQQAKQLQQVQLQQRLQAQLQQQQQLSQNVNANTNALGFMTGLPNAGATGAFNPAQAQVRPGGGLPPGFGSQEMSAQYQALQQQQQRAFPNQQQQPQGMPNFLNMGAGVGGGNSQSAMEMFQNLLSGQKPS